MTRNLRLDVRLVAHHQLPVPDNPEYLRGWLAHAHVVLTKDDLDQVPWCTPEVVPYRFVEHVRCSVAAALPAPELSQVVVAGVERGWLDRCEAVELVLAALDGARRPSDRKAWLGAWLDDLGVTDAEIVACADALVPVLANDPGAVQRLAPVLIARVDDDRLADVATVALATPTKKVLRTVLEALATRSRPSTQTAQVLGPQVIAVDVSSDRPSARAVQTVLDTWGLSGDVPPEPTQVKGLWQPVPPVWIPPRFDHGEDSVEALVLAAAELSARPGMHIVDLAVERFLALANAVARRDPDLARSALSGVCDTSDAGLAPVAGWVHGRPGGYLDNKAHKVPSCRLRGLLEAREAAVFQRLGQVPCLLSEPSTVDLQIAPQDLLDRLQAYHDAGASASESDLLLALTRLDVSGADPRLRHTLDGLAVPVLLQSGKPVTFTAGPAASRYLADPAVEPAELTTWWPGLYQWSVTVWKVEKKDVPGSLRGFPPRLTMQGADSAVFPTWGDTVLDVDTYEYNRGLGLQMRRVANRAAPLAPPAVLEFLTAGRTAHPAAVADTAAAVAEAWGRGLLRPGTPGGRYVDLDTPPGGLAAMARLLGQAAGEGLLAVVWQVLDDLAGVAASGQRIATGASEVVGTIATLLPEVVHAVAEGTADPAVLTMPGTRAVAARSGTSKAVTTARAVVSARPDARTRIRG
ncbi:MAG: hypothetical protein FWE61_09375 [Micrococcales bacterium]|nr:hypothetical protein [Micrococcales bacterium]